MDALEKTIIPMSESFGDAGKLIRALSAPFDPCAVKFKAALITGHRALALPYIDPTLIRDRLNAVLGRAAWHEEYEWLPEGSVVCRLRLRLGNEWITKSDIGVPGKRMQEDNAQKTAVSEALLRTAAKFGIGRYLYRLPAQWLDYDPQKQAFICLPTLAAPKPALVRKKRKLTGRRKVVA